MNKLPKILQDLYSKNLEFFRVQNPSIFNVIKNITPDHSSIVISDSGKIDLVYKGRSIYGGDAIEYVEGEVKKFNKIYEDKKRATSINAVYPGLYNGPRFFHTHLNQTITDLYDASEAIYPNALHTNNRHDFLIVMGIGLGLHISELLDRTNIQNILILETDFELLALSCYCTDWESVYQKQDPKNKKSITLTLVNQNNLQNEQGSLWNELIKRAPHFPFNTVYYNHGGHDKYGDFIRNINKDITMFMSLWGFYDDETNQLNHILHNIKNIKLIPSSDSFKWKKPIIICGSAPSLDTRIEQLKAIREHCILLSAGTSLPALLGNGLTPDYHIEIESDYGVYHSINAIEDKASLKEITLICALQCSPYITPFFKESFAFVKDSMSIGDLIESKNNKLENPTPTCVNAALALTFHFKSEEIYLFGTDFGFYHRDNHHSKHSIYNKEDADTEEIRTANNNNMDKHFSSEGYSGECYTTDLFFTTKRRLEVSIISFKNQYKFDIYNCSDGLIISDTKHIEKDSKITLKTYKGDDNDFRSHTRKLTLDMQEVMMTGLYEPVKELCDILIKNLENMNPDIETLSAITWSISNYLNQSFSQNNGALLYFIRGTIWHYMTSGYSIAYACEPHNQEKVIDIWRTRFINFLTLLPNDLLKNINKDRSSMDDDSQLTKTIREEIEI